MQAQTAQHITSATQVSQINNDDIIIDDNQAIRNDKPVVVQRHDEGALGAYGQTFVLAPTFCLRIGAEDSLLLASAVRQEGMAMLLQSELSGKPDIMGCAFDAAVAPGLSHDARRVYDEDNAGGTSRNSEAMSMELLGRAFGAILQKTEMQLKYFPSNSPITDMCISIDGIELGVSVTRALHRPLAQFKLEDAESLLRKKLKGVIAATETVYNASWRKQLLHVWAGSAAIARLLEQAYALLEPELVSDTIVLVTLCRGMPEIFDERLRKLERRQRVVKGLKDERHLAILRESEPNAQQRS